MVVTVAVQVSLMVLVIAESQFVKDEASNFNSCTMSNRWYITIMEAYCSLPNCGMPSTLICDA